MSSWAGISWWRRIGYYLAWVPAVIGALMAGPTGSAGGWSPMDPRRLRDAPDHPNPEDDDLTEPQ